MQNRNKNNAPQRRRGEAKEEAAEEAGEEAEEADDAEEADEEAEDEDEDEALSEVGNGACHYNYANLYNYYCTHHPSDRRSPGPRRPHRIHLPRRLPSHLSRQYVFFSGVIAS